MMQVFSVMRASACMLICATMVSLGWCWRCLAFPMPLIMPAVCWLCSGHVHLLALNSEIDMSPGSAQWNFAVADLAAVDRSKTPFVVMQWHRLMYSAAASSNSDYQWGDTVRAMCTCLVSRMPGMIYGAFFWVSWCSVRI